MRHVYSAVSIPPAELSHFEAEGPAGAGTAGGDLKASLRRDQRRLDEALRLPRRAVSPFLESGDSHRAGRALVNMSTVHSRVWRTEQAMPALPRARDGFVAEGVPFDTALVSLELATLYAEQGRTAELKKLAGEMIPIFTAHQIHREALAAFLFLQQATEAERVGAEVAARIAAYLRRAQHDPGHRFDEGA